MSNFTDYLSKCKHFLECNFAIDMDYDLIIDGSLHAIEVDHMCGWIVYYLCDGKIKYDFINNHQYFTEITGDSKKEELASLLDVTERRIKFPGPDCINPYINPLTYEDK